jgi:hypothetical protein
VVQICFQNAFSICILSEATLNKKVLKQLSELQLGDLVGVTWLDASKGRLETVEEMRESGVSGAEIDLPVTSYAFT